MKHRLWYDDNVDIIFLEFEGDYLSTDVPQVRAKMFELLEGKPLRQAVIELSSKYKVENRKTRELANKALIDGKITHVAFWGGNAANRMIAKVMIKTGGLKIKGNFLKTKDDAINWILNQR
ncbi:MAG: hypothetical protein R3182_00175 [Draconibacterium sp.]|nr:hypothetical protein [Draconibacterium sp.]